jgi:very-short-patch-repair endonuclease
MNENELKFFRVLEQVVGDKYYILPQVVISDLVDVKQRGFLRKSYRTKIDKKTIDFCLFNKTDYSLYAAIELDGYSHLEPKTQERDIFVEDLFHRIGIPLKRINNSESYNLEEISSKLG